MNRGLSLVELMVALACCSLVILCVWRIHVMSSVHFRQMRDQWHCMQSLRLASFRLHADLVQRACLMPQELAVRTRGSELFIAGIPVTSQHPGIRLHARKAPPYHAVAVGASATAVVLDTTDIDQDGLDDFTAYQGIITDSTFGTIGSRYVQGSVVVPIAASLPPAIGDRVVPAVHYMMTPDGLYRNGQLLAETIVSFEPRINQDTLTVSMQARSHGTTKTLSLSYPIR